MGYDEAVSKNTSKYVITLPLIKKQEKSGKVSESLENIELKINQLSTMIDWQIQEQERRTENYKDTLVQRLEAMLEEERNRTDRLIQFTLNS